jgi:hypothetical protein
VAISMVPFKCPEKDFLWERYENPPSNEAQDQDGMSGLRIERTGCLRLHDAIDALRT